MNILEWKYKLHGRPYRGGDGGGGDGGGDNGGPSPSSIGGGNPADAAAGVAGSTGSSGPAGLSGPDASPGPSSIGGSNPADVAAGVAGSPSPAAGPSSVGGGNPADAAAGVPGSTAGFNLADMSSSGPAPGTPGAGKAGETAVGGYGSMASPASVTATAETAANQLGIQSAMSQFSSPGLTAAANNGSVPGFSTNGVSMAALQGFQNAGYGNAPVSDNQNIDQALASNNVATNVMPIVAGLITAAVPGASLAINLAKGLANNQTPTEIAQGLLGNLVAGKVNSTVMGALPVDVAKGISTANQVSTIGNMFGLGLPSINPGAAVAGLISGGNQSASSGPVDGSGTSIDYGNFGGSGGTPTGGSPAPAAPSTPSTPSTPASRALNTNMRFNLSQASEMGKAIRRGAMSRRY